MHIRDNEHDWTFLPELGPDWAYCERCDKCYHVDTPEKLVTYMVALREVEKTNVKNSVH